MVYNPDLTASKELITGILVADLTPAQLDTIQQKFGNGANLCRPYPSEQLFIYDKRSWARKSHADMLRSMPDVSSLVVIDARSAKDGSVWYIDRFATSNDVAAGEAVNTNALLKVRMKSEDIVISYSNSRFSPGSFRFEMDQVEIEYPTPEEFDQEEVYTHGFDLIKDRFLNPCWVTATPDEMETSTDPDILDKFFPRPNVVYRLKAEVARADGLKVGWTMGNLARDVALQDGTILRFPAGSQALQCDYDPDAPIRRYEKPEGSL